MNKPETVMVSYLCPTALDNALRAIAKLGGVSKSQLIRTIILNGLVTVNENEKIKEGL